MDMSFELKNDIPVWHRPAQSHALYHTPPTQITSRNMSNLGRQFLDESSQGSTSSARELCFTPFAADQVQMNDISPTMDNRPTSHISVTGCSRMTTGTGAKKATVNFHSIADLMKSDAVETPTNTDIDIGNANKNDGAAKELKKTTFRPISTEDNFVVTNERPPSLTPPPTPTPDENQKPLKSKVISASQGGKKGRTIYRPEQIQILETMFGKTQYPDAMTMEGLARELGVSEVKIKVWFQNKRARWRRRVSEPDSGNNTHALSPPNISTTNKPLTSLTPKLEAAPLMNNLMPQTGSWMPNAAMFPMMSPIAFNNGLIPPFIGMNGLPMPMNSPQAFHPSAVKLLQSMPQSFYPSSMFSPVSPKDTALKTSPNSQALRQSMQPLSDLTNSTRLHSQT